MTRYDKKVLAFVVIVTAALFLFLTPWCFSAWDNDKPADSDAWNNAAGFIRANNDALETIFGVDFAHFDNADNHDDFEDAIDDIGSTETTLWVHETEVVSDDLTIPDNVTLFFTRGGTLAPATTKTITINGHIIAGDYQIFTGAGTVTFADFKKINCVWYSDSGTGTDASRWVNALRDAFAGSGAYQHYYLPAGNYEDATTINLESTGRIKISGDGVEVTQIHYATADATSAIKIHDTGNNTSPEIFMSDLSFEGETTCTGAAIELEDIVIGVFERLNIENFNGATTSKGFWIKGRDRMTFDRIVMSKTSIGFHIDDNPNNSIDLDHCRFLNINIGCDDADNGYGWKIDCDGILGNLTWANTGTNNCRYGVYYKAGTAAAAPFMWSFKNMRFEQGDTINKDCWAFHLEGTSSYPVRNALFENVYFGGSYNGIKTIYGYTHTFINCHWPAGAGYTHWDIDDNIIGCAIINSKYNPAGTDARPVDAELIYKLENSTNGYIGFVQYDDSRTSWENGEISGSDTWDPASIADGNEESKEVTVTGAALGDYVHVSFSVDVADLVLDAQVTVANKITCILANNTGSAVDLASGTIYVKVIQK